MNTEPKIIRIPRCPICGKEIMMGRSKFGLCSKHQDMADTFIWCLNNINVKNIDPNKTDSGLYLPK